LADIDPSDEAQHVGNGVGARAADVVLADDRQVRGGVAGLLHLPVTVVVTASP
jgi:hypothetical protein